MSALRLAIPALLALCLAADAGAGPISLPECLASARRHAPSLRAAEAGVSRAEQAIREARAALSPALRFSANLVQNSEAPKVVFPLPGSPSPQVIQTASATALDARVAGEYTLYSGGRDAALLHAAEAQRFGQQRSREQAEADLELRVSQAYYRVLAAQRLDSAAREAIASARAHLTASAARVTAGVSPRLDSLRAAVDLAQRATAVARAAEAVRVARVELESAIGAPLDPAASLGEPGDPALDVPDDSAAVARALASRPELAALDQSLRENREREQAARAARGPVVSLNATAQYLGPNRSEDYWDTSDPGLRTHRLFAGIGVTMPIFDAGLASARAGEIAADRLGIEARRQEAALGIRREIAQALSDLRVALAVWQVDIGRVATAREALRIASAGYRGGTSTGTDVRDAETSLADSRADEAQSLMDCWTARAALDHALGATAGRER